MIKIARGSCRNWKAIPGLAQLKTFVSDWPLTALCVPSLACTPRKVTVPPPCGQERSQLWGHRLGSRLSPTTPHLPILKMRGKQIQPWSSIGSSRKCTGRRKSKEKLLDLCLQAVFQRKPRNQVRKNLAKNQVFFLLKLWTISVKSNLGDSGDSGLIPGSRRSPGVGNGYPLVFLPHGQRSLVG